MISLTPPTQRKVALALGVPAGLVVAVVLFLLVKDYLVARREAPLDKQRIATLEEQMKEDATKGAALTAELDRQTAVSLERDARHSIEAKVLIASAVLFLVCVKWFVSLSRPAPVALSTIRAQHDAIARRPKKAKGHPRRPAPTEAPETEPLDLSIVDAIVEREGRGREAAIPIIQAIQAHYRYLPDEALKRVCELTEIPPAQIAGVSTFYSQFRRSPMGKHLLKVCHGTACHVSGARTITDEIRRHLVIAPDEDTDPQRMFTVEEVACVGCCSLAPVIMLDDVTAGRLTPATACDAIEAHRERGDA